MTSRTERIAALVEDTEHLDRAGRSAAINRFVLNELGLQEDAKFFDSYDLNLIQSRAVSIMQQEPVHSELCKETHGYGSDFMRTACYVQATTEFLRNRKFIDFMVSFRKSHKKAANVGFCKHERVKQDGSNYHCQDCSEIVTPVMFTVKR